MFRRRTAAVRGRLRGLSAAKGRGGRPVLRGVALGRGLGAALGISPEILELIYARAHRWFSVGKPDRAEPLFRALCIADGRVADYWVGLGVCLRLRKDWESASLAFSVAASLRPAWAVPVFHACELALATGDIAEAGRHMKQLEAILASGSRPSRLPESMLAEAAGWRRRSSCAPVGGNARMNLSALGGIAINEKLDLIREISRNLLGEAPPPGLPSPGRQDPPGRPVPRRSSAAWTRRRRSSCRAFARGALPARHTPAVHHAGGSRGAEAGRDPADHATPLERRGGGRRGRASRPERARPRSRREPRRAAGGFRRCRNGRRAGAGRSPHCAKGRAFGRRAGGRRRRDASRHRIAGRRSAGASGRSGGGAGFARPAYAGRSTAAAPDERAGGSPLLSAGAAGAGPTCHAEGGSGGGAGDARPPRRCRRPRRRPGRDPRLVHSQRAHAARLAPPRPFVGIAQSLQGTGPAATPQLSMNEELLLDLSPQSRPQPRTHRPRPEGDKIGPAPKIGDFTASPPPFERDGVLHIVELGTGLPSSRPRTGKTTAHAHCCRARACAPTWLRPPRQARTNRSIREGGTLHMTDPCNARRPSRYPPSRRGRDSAIRFPSTPRNTRPPSRCAAKDGRRQGGRPVRGLSQPGRHLRSCQERRGHRFRHRQPHPRRQRLFASRRQDAVLSGAGRGRVGGEPAPGGAPPAPARCFWPPRRGRQPPTSQLPRTMTMCRPAGRARRAGCSARCRRSATGR